MSRGIVALHQNNHVSHYRNKNMALRLMSITLVLIAAALRQ
jgi:hypothetical protein